MLENSTTSSSPAASDNSPGDGGGDSGGPATEGQAHAAFSSAFAGFSDVRKGLYELCLAKLAGARAHVGGGGSGSGSGSGLCAQSTTEEDGPAAAGKFSVRRAQLPAEAASGTLKSLPPPGEEHDGSRVSAEEGLDRRRVLVEGDEWVVREFRRVGASVKAVRVICRVRLQNVSAGGTCLCVCFVIFLCL